MIYRAISHLLGQLIGPDVEQVVIAEPQGLCVLDAQAAQGDLHLIAWPDNMFSSLGTNKIE